MCGYAYLHIIIFVLIIRLSCRNKMTKKLTYDMMTLRTQRSLVDFAETKELVINNQINPISNIRKRPVHDSNKKLLSECVPWVEWMFATQSTQKGFQVTSFSLSTFPLNMAHKLIWPLTASSGLRKVATRQQRTARTYYGKSTTIGNGTCSLIWYQAQQDWFPRKNWGRIISNW